MICFLSWILPSPTMQSSVQSDTAEDLRHNSITQETNKSFERNTTNIYLMSLCSLGAYILIHDYDYAKINQDVVSKMIS